MQSPRSQRTAWRPDPPGLHYGVVRFRAPAVIQLRRAQLTLIFVALIPTILITATGVVLLALRPDTSGLVAGILVLAFCTTSLTGYILGSIFVSRGATVARFQHDFLSSVSHELRTPLTSISMFIETLRDERLTDPAEKEKCLELLDQEIARLGGLVERLLELSRLEAAGRQMFETADVRIDDLVNDALMAFYAATMSEKVQVKVDLEPDLVVRGDKTSLTQALANLLVNAWKHSPSGDKEISLTTRATGKHAEILIADNGPGIPPDEQRRIFDRFERGQAAIDGSTHGSGLGLAIVRAVVRAHRGRIDVRSQPGSGSQFRIRLRRQNAAP